MTETRQGKRDYYHLFAAQGLALIATGVATVALALLAYRIAGSESGEVLGTALAIKVATYLLVAPFGAVFAARLPRRGLLVTLDLLRAGVALLLPWATEVWHIYALIVVFQAASGVFTPTYQALVPELLTDERDYALALSRSRLLQELEGAISPGIAAALLVVFSFFGLFAVAVAALCLSALLILRVSFPPPPQAGKQGPFRRFMRGVEHFRRTPRLRALAALNCGVAAGAAMVTVNTVVFVQGRLGLTPGEAAIALSVAGLGSVAGALAAPRLLPVLPDRLIMLGGAGLSSLALLAGPLAQGYAGLLLIWGALGLGGALTATLAGTLLRRSGEPADRPALYAAQIALSNGALVVASLLAGWIGSRLGPGAAFGVMAGIGLVALATATLAWPRADLGGSRTLPHAPDEDWRWDGPS